MRHTRRSMSTVRIHVFYIRPVSLSTLYLVPHQRHLVYYTSVHYGMGADFNQKIERCSFLGWVIVFANQLKVVPFVRYTLECGIQVNEPNGFPWKTAVQHNNEPLLRLLLSAGAVDDITYAIDYAMYYYSKCESVIQALEEYKKKAEDDTTHSPVWLF